MGQRGRQHNKRQKPRSSTAPSLMRAPTPVMEKLPPVVYGKPFVVLEDSHRDTFVYKGGSWVRHTKTIAECRQDCQVKELAQKINGMTRYEVAAPVSSAN